MCLLRSPTNAIQSSILNDSSVKMIIWIHLIVACSAYVRRHTDGSISSNSGPKLIDESTSSAGFHEQILRHSRQANDGSRLITAYALSYEDQQFLLSEHNRFRRMVPASDIKEMYWDTNLAASAQAYANQCTFQHSSNRVNTGENIWASPYSNLRGAVKMWFDEVYDTRCGCTNSFKECCGHYTQVVWARSNRLGCGLARCTNILYAGRRQHSLICHYNPAGNLIRPGNVAVGGFTYRSQNEPVCGGCAPGSECRYGLCSF